MAEAEDVILQAAEQVTSMARTLWRRHRPTAESPGLSLIEVSRRLTALIHACFGREWPLIPTGAEAVPTWLAMRLRMLPPWVRDGHAYAFSDGVQIFLPRDLRVLGDASKDADLLRVMALILAARLARGR